MQGLAANDDELGFAGNSPRCAKHVVKLRFLHATAPARRAAAYPRTAETGAVDFRGHPHSEKLHTVERYTRLSLGQLEVETLLEDPVYYTKPFKIKFTARLMPGADLMEYICQENNQDVHHIQGPAGTP